KQKRLYIYFNIIFGWTIVFWLFSFYKAFYK
ncbi:MAG: superinfection immunity protein, partial [Alphaproteobacteria bacterium]|nr:superinfection immunity protein [Alphaproteobacteria bacterium]